MLKIKQGDNVIVFPSRKNFDDVRKQVYRNVCDYIEKGTVKPLTVYYDSWAARVDACEHENPERVWRDRYYKIFSVEEYCKLPNGRPRDIVPNKMFVYRNLRKSLGTLAGTDAAFVEAYYAGVTKTFYGDFKQC